MSVFVDTAGLLAILDGDDPHLTAISKSRALKSSLDLRVFRTALIAALLLALALAATAQDRATHQYVVVRLDPATGAEVWRVEPDLPGVPEVHVDVDGTLLVLGREWIGLDPDALAAELDRALEADEAPVIGHEALHAVRLAPADGAMLDPAPPIPDDLDALTGPMAELPRPLTADDGTVLVDKRIAGLQFDPDEAHFRLDAIDPRTGETRAIRRVETIPHDLHVVGHWAIFSLAGEASILRGGEVVALDLERGTLVWQFDAWRHGPAPENALTEVAIDGDRVLVAVDQVVHAVELESGALLWRRELPRQELLSWESPRTRFGRFEGDLLVQCHENLFRLDPSTGEIVWSWEAGPEGVTWPTVFPAVETASVETEFYVVAQLAAEDLEGVADDDGGDEDWGEEVFSASLVRVELTPSGEILLEGAATDEVPEGAPTWSSLMAPIPAPEGAPTWTIERLNSFFPDDELQLSPLDLSGLLETEGVAWVQLTDAVDKIVVRRDGEQVAELVLREAPTWLGGDMPVIPLRYSLIILLTGLAAMAHSAMAVRKSTARFRIPEVGGLYKSSLFKSNLATMLISGGCSLIVGVPMLFLGLLFGGIFHVLTFVLVFVAAAVGHFSSVNWTALLGNADLGVAARKTLTRLGAPAGGVFVGVFEPSRKTFFNQSVDTHDDIGLLSLAETELVFDGLRYRRVVPRASITALRRPLVWQFVFLGLRWLEIEYSIDGKSRTLRVGSREKHSIRGNHHATSDLAKRVAQWAGVALS